MGPVASLSQRREVLGPARQAQARGGSRVRGYGRQRLHRCGADAERGAFSPRRRCSMCRDTGAMRGARFTRWRRSAPSARSCPYRSAAEAIELARRGGGSLVSSVFSADDVAAAQLVLGLAPYHGRIIVVNRDCAKESTGHGSPLPHLVHGGPGRAGGGEELGGIRGVMHYMQRTAVQGTPDLHHRGHGPLGARRAAKSSTRARHPVPQASPGALAIGDTFPFPPSARA